MMNGRKMMILLALCSMLAIGCGTESNNGAATNNGATNNGANNGATNNGATNNDAANNGTTNTTNNGTTPNNGQTTVQNNGTFPDEPYVTEFIYYEETQDGFTGTKTGIVVGLSGLQISSLAGNQKLLEQEDADAFAAAHMQTATIEAMRNGWNCPDPISEMNSDMGMTGTDAGSTIEPSRWFFEARIQEDGNMRHPQEITGCVEAGDTAVLDIIDAMDALALEYGIVR